MYICVCVCVCLPMQDVQSSSAHGNYIAGLISNLRLSLKFQDGYTSLAFTSLMVWIEMTKIMGVEVGTPESPAISSPAAAYGFGFGKCEISSKSAETWQQNPATVG